jgi:hypothetical protein
LGEDFRSKIVRNNEDKENYEKYESCVKNDSMTESCLKCRRKPVTADSDNVYEFCARCNFECISE